jgi:hypothetical protein
MCPEELKQFYAMFNGVSLSWNSEVLGKSINVGNIRINRFNEILPVSFEGDVCQCKYQGQIVSIPDQATHQPFIIDSNCNAGNVVMFLCSTSSLKTSDDKKRSTEIWFQDLSWRWHFICHTMTQYLRLMVAHLGIHGWQLLYTPEGLPRNTIQWMTMFCKERLCADFLYRSIC